MPLTPDRSPGVSQEEGTVYSDEGVFATQQGEVRYTAGRFSLYDGSGEFDPRTGSSGISEAAHRALDELIHNLAEDLHVTKVEVMGQLTEVIAWTDNAETVRVRAWVATRVLGQITQVDCIQYNGAGTEVQRVTTVPNRVLGVTNTYTVTKTGT